MDREWIHQKLTEYRSLLDAYLTTPIEPGGWWRPDNEARAELRRREPTIKEILKNLDPELADINVDGMGGDAAARDAVDRGLGILAERDEWKAKLAPEAPVMPADQFHPWIWQAAQTLWDSEHYRHAVQAAATAINDHAQNKLGRRDTADTQLLQEAFSPNPPEKGKPRLRCPGDHNNPTVQSRQRGALQYASGCFAAIRNPATHEQDEWDQQVALEYLAALSVLARWVDGWTLDTAP
jgi:uncharacterized protein (TIGR02391 family)